MTDPPATDLTATATAPWRREGFLPRAPLDSHGYLGDGPPRACTLDELKAAITRVPRERIHFVWTPGRGSVVPAGEATEVFEAVRAAELGRAHDTLSSKTGWALVAAAGIWFFQPQLGMSLSWLIMLWTVFFGLPIVDAVLRARAWKRATPEGAQARGDDSRFQHWLAWQEPTRTTHVIIGVLVATWLLGEQAGAMRSVRVFAMDDSGVRAGQWWRPLTCFFIHADLVHLIFNCMALSRLGRWVEVVTQPSWIPIILLMSTLGGSLAGYVLPPQVPSVGASGGILGLLGFLIVVSYPPVRQVPAGFHRLLWQWVGFIALLGLIGWNVIDNAGHLGGLMTGSLLGGAANVVLPQRLPPVRTPWVRAPGFVCAAVLAIVGGWMAWTLWQAAPSGP